jgi:para-aminobenzoate synthetase/4-amino-4-deoxychorismate lyase
MKQWKDLPEAVYNWAAQEPYTVLLATARFDETNRTSYFYREPVRVLEARSLDELRDFFAGMDAAHAEGYHLAGYLSYECGSYFEARVEPRDEPQELPLAWFGVYREPIRFDHASGEFDGPVPEIREAVRHGAGGGFSCSGLEISRDEYGRRIAQIQELIAAGETYQVNFTDRVRVGTSLDAAEAFRALLNNQRVSYAALLNVDGRQILSISPELFFHIEDGVLTTKPMKGTAERGFNLKNDMVATGKLRQDEKSRSEHVMIVDLLRNDLGRICETGSVRVEEIFAVEKYETLLQMTSTIRGKLKPGLMYSEIFRGLFPGGSITGAPKVRTMQIIRRLEDEARGVYTGAIGHIRPDGASTFNIPIRTLVMKDGVGTMGVGSGIVADSIATSEYEECKLKTGFLTAQNGEFELIETLLWKDGYFLFDEHLARLETSALYFDFVYNYDKIRYELEFLIRQFFTSGKYRVRLVLRKDGSFSLSYLAFSPDKHGLRVLVANERTNSGDRFLRHKTTRRDLYDRVLKQAQEAGYDEVLFLNEREELTEGAISSLFVERERRLLTPPLDCGVLPGTYRQRLLKREKASEERVLFLDDLQDSDAVYLVNSVREKRKVAELVIGDGSVLRWR